MARLFVSIELPALVRAEMNRLQCDVPGARWAPVEQLHLTLRFIGELDGLARRDAEAALDEVEAAPFELLLAGVGHFPPRGQPRVLWVGVEPSPALLELHERICRGWGERACRRRPVIFTPTSRSPDCATRRRGPSLLSSCSTISSARDRSRLTASISTRAASVRAARCTRPRRAGRSTEARSSAPGRGTGPRRSG